MQKELETTLKERKSDYGDYRGGSALRAHLMSIIKDRHKAVHRSTMAPLYEIYIFDIVNKISRLAVSPTHEDSWLDIQGYSKRALEAIREEKARCKEVESDYLERLKKDKKDANK